MNIFENSVAQSSAALLRESLRIYRDKDDNQIYVSFYFNRGKGSGTQKVLLSEFAAFIEALSELSNGVTSTAEGRVPADEMVRRTASLDDESGLLSFRCNSGKGAKPATLSPTEIPTLVEILTGALPQIQAAVRKL